jgi:hypothetical protein
MLKRRNEGLDLRDSRTFQGQTSKTFWAGFKSEAPRVETGKQAFSNEERSQRNKHSVLYAANKMKSMDNSLFPLLQTVGEAETIAQSRFDGGQHGLS